MFVICDNFVFLNVNNSMIDNGEEFDQINKPTEVNYSDQPLFIFTDRLSLPFFIPQSDNEDSQSIR